jgi:hypothetical protein
MKLTFRNDRGVFWRDQFRRDRYIFKSISSTTHLCVSGQKVFCEVKKGQPQ